VWIDLKDTDADLAGFHYLKNYKQNFDVFSEGLASSGRFPSRQGHLQEILQGGGGKVISTE
jgi:hypothetical protein